jgi:hypothetical protein
VFYTRRFHPSHPFPVPFPLSYAPSPPLGAGPALHGRGRRGGPGPEAHTRQALRNKAHRAQGSPSRAAAAAAAAALFCLAAALVCKRIAELNVPPSLAHLHPLHPTHRAIWRSPYRFSLLPHCRLDDSMQILREAWGIPKFWAIAMPWVAGLQGKTDSCPACARVRLLSPRPAVCERISWAGLTYVWKLELLEDVCSFLNGLAIRQTKRIQHP